MTATISRLPLMAGGAIASSIGRAGLWALSQYARAPLASTAILAMTTLSVMAASNALYFQKHHHPAPLFGGRTEQVAEIVAPAVRSVPVQRVAPKAEPLPDYQTLPQVDNSETTGSVGTRASTSTSAAQPDGEPMGNAQVYNVQKKLAEMKLFTGTVDGYYGPMTASAIRAFELSAGMKPQGAITKDVVDAILRAPTFNPVAATQRQPVQQQQQLTQQPVRSQQVMAEAQPRRAMAPAKEQPVLLARVAEAEPEMALDAAGDSAAQALDNIVASLQGTAEPVMERKVTPQKTAALTPPATIEADRNYTGTPTSDPIIVGKVQRGLASLGFLAGSVDGKPGEATAKAIRNFEVYYNYKVTGQVTAELVNMLVAAGAVI